MTYRSFSFLIFGQTIIWILLWCIYYLIYNKNVKMSCLHKVHVQNDLHVHFPSLYRQQWKMRLKNWKIYCIPDSEGFHRPNFELSKLMLGSLTKEITLKFRDKFFVSFALFPAALEPRLKCFFLGPSHKTPETSRWPRAWLKKKRDSSQSNSKLANWRIQTL